MSDTPKPTGRPPIYTELEPFENAVNAYFEHCDKQTTTTYDDKGRMHTRYKPYTITGLAQHLGMTTETLRQYGENQIFSATVKRAKEKIEDWIVEHSLNRDIDATMSIFNLKNNFGWKDKQEVDISSEKGFNVEIKIVD